MLCLSRFSLSWGFRGGLVVKNLPANAGAVGLFPGQGRSHMLQSNWAYVSQLLSLGAATTEAHTPGARAPQQEKPPQWDVCKPQLESSPCSLQPEESPSNIKDPAQPIYKQNCFKKERKEETTYKRFTLSCFMKEKKSHNNKELTLRRSWCS